MQKSTFIHTLSEYNNIFALEQRAIVLSFVKNIAFLLGHSVSAKRSIQASLGAKSRTSSSQRVSTIIQHCATTTKSPRQTLTKRNSFPNLSKGTSALRANILIRITSMRYFIILKSQMTTGLTWAMSMSLWKMLTPKHSLS